MIGSDPGLLRLRMASRTTAALACALAILYVLTRATGQPVTVALLGVLITMVSGRAVNEPDPRRQKITMALLPLPAALAITAGTVLAPHKVVSDVVFVGIVFGAVYIRRFGPRGRALGMVMFMAYFFTLFLRATTAELPWLIGAIVVGTACSFVITTYVLPDRPERVLQATMRSLRARMAIVVGTTAEAIAAGRLDERRRRRLRARIARLNDTALMVQSQIEDKVNPAPLWPGVSGEDLALWLFDAELTVERVVTAGARLADAGAEIPAATRAELAAALSQLARAIRLPQPEGLRRVADRAQQLIDRHSGEALVRRLGLAVIATATAASEVRAMVDRASGASTAPPPHKAEPDKPPTGLRPTTRQAVQVAVAASLAIVVGELVSPARWYWAVIAAFVIFAGTNTWGETLTKGWQRMLGTALGVPCGILIATLVSGNRAVSLVLVFVCLFCSFYFMRVAYSLMTFWITTMLALLYGLLGQFTFGLLLLRIEETAIGAVIGIAVAILVLPTNTRTAIRSDGHTFLTTLSELIEGSVASLFGGKEATSPTDKARELDRNLQQFRTTAKPLLAGVAGISGRRSIRRALRVLSACDRYARALARNSERYGDPSPQLVDAVTSAAAQIRRNVEALDAVPYQHAIVAPATDFLDTAESLVCQQDGDPEPGSDGRRLLSALQALRQIDRAVVTEAVDLGADERTKLPGRSSR
ncbi:MAG TPA: FUSC family protein [Mycobacterium sp.]|uniref:FUSC family protein n=1 Tax=Mycobacterium sp. TaxID=1785 RepID=UPI002D6EE184|nr:FUSC family protein [Mycobacterium sp.]HZU50171.1 FUSC family protein [Mycobacterium sp.]